MKPISVLLVEDEVIIAMLIERQLAELGCTMLARATTGEQAVELAREKRPELIFMDIKLAGVMTGIDAWRAISAFSRIPTIFMTAYGTPQIRAEVAECHPVDFIEKPLPQLRLQEALKRYREEFGEPIKLV